MDKSEFGHCSPRLTGSSAASDIQNEFVTSLCSALLAHSPWPYKMTHSVDLWATRYNFFCSGNRPLMHYSWATEVCAEVSESPWLTWRLGDVLRAVGEDQYLNVSRSLFFLKDIYWALVELILPKCFKFIWLFFLLVLKQAGQASFSHRALSLYTNHQARGEAVPCGRSLTLSVCICLIRKATKNGRHLIQHVVVMAGTSAWVVKAKNNGWGESLQREMLERSLVSFPTTRREMGKGCGHSQPAGTPLVCLLLPECMPVGRGWGIAEVIVMSREISRGSMSPCALAGLGGHLLLFPAELLLSPSFSIVSACWGGTSGSSKASWKVLDGKAVNGP